VHIVVLNWRDTANPEGGGSEVYIEEIAQRLVARGHIVTLVCAGHDQAPRMDIRHGVRFIRVGSKLTVYSRARHLLRSGALGRVDVVVDTQNGIPFFAPWATSVPTVALVHHVHREQWPVVYDPIRARIGWHIESRWAPFVYRRSAYIVVSDATRIELTALGVARESITVVHNGTLPATDTHTPQDPHPRILVLGRLVPHKRVEHVLLAAARLRGRHPHLRVAIVGDGWWASDLRDSAARLGVHDITDFTGHVDEDEKARQIARSWVLALPSIKEGWGLVVLEAASAGVPAVAYAEAGGVAESVVDGQTGVLVYGDDEDFTAAIESLITHRQQRETMGKDARAHAARFSWDASAERFEAVLAEAMATAASRGASSWIRRRRRAYRR
jgi:glycosyltransferase involved in cell wall biosynthesis